MEDQETSVSERVAIKMILSHLIGELELVANEYKRKAKYKRYSRGM